MATIKNETFYKSQKLWTNTHPFLNNKRYNFYLTSNIEKIQCGSLLLNKVIALNLRKKKLRKNISAQNMFISQQKFHQLKYLPKLPQTLTCQFIPHQKNPLIKMKSKIDLL